MVAAVIAVLMIVTTIFDSKCSKPMEMGADGTYTVPEPEGVCVYKQLFALFSFAAFVIVGYITCTVCTQAWHDTLPRVREPPPRER